MSSGERRWMRVVVETDGRWKTRMEGERGIPMSFFLQNRAKSISFSMYVGISNNILSGPHAQPNQNNMRIRPLGAACLKLGFNRGSAATVHVRFATHSSICRSAYQYSHQHPIPSPCHYFHQYLEFEDAQGIQVILIYLYERCMCTIRWCNIAIGIESALLVKTADAMVRLFLRGRCVQKASQKVW